MKTYTKKKKKKKANQNNLPRGKRTIKSILLKERVQMGMGKFFLKYDLEKKWYNKVIEEGKC